MDKGKNPIQEEENVFHSPKNYLPNVASSSSQPPVKLETSSKQSDSGSAAEEAVVLNEMDNSAAAGASPVSAMPAQASASIAGRPVRVVRKPMPPEELEALARTDPKKAKKIMTNRVSAMRTKEKRKLYTCLREHDLLKLQTQAAHLSAKLTLLMTEQKSLISENTKLKDSANVVKQKIDQQQSKNDEIRREIQMYRYFVDRQMRAALNAGNRNTINLSSATNQVGGLESQFICRSCRGI